MNFDLSSEQRQLQDVVASFLDDHCDQARLHELYDADGDLDAELWSGTCDLGLAGLHLPVEYEGSGQGALDLVAVADVLGRHGAPVPFVTNALAAAAILEAGSAKQRDEHLPALATGSSLATVALLDRDGGWDPSAWNMDVGDDGSVTGRKEMVEFGSVARLFVVGLAGGRFGLVRADADGVGIEPVDTVDRTRRLASVVFDHAAVEVLAGPSADDPAVARRVVDLGAALLAADAVGGANRVLDMCVEYATERRQFGVPIGSFQAVKHQIADLALDVAPCRALAWYVGHAIDERSDDASRMASIAKSHLTERYSAAARSAVEIHGGIGFTWEFDLHIFLKRAIQDRVLLGSPSAHRERAAALAGW